MLKKLALATAAVDYLCLLPAPTTTLSRKGDQEVQGCRNKADETTWIQVGPASFKTQRDAEKQVKTVCVEK